MQHTIRRILTQDYTDAQDSSAASVLYQNGHELTSDEGRELLDSLFAGVHPILTQHTLRDFVYSSPANRRNYFERLLQIDELTALIERAVVGDARTRDFPCPTAPDGDRRLEVVRGTCSTTAGARQALKDLAKRRDEASVALPVALLTVAASEFDVKLADLILTEREIERRQEEQRTRQLPLLGQLRLQVSSPLSAVDGLLAAADAVKAALDSKLSAEQALQRTLAPDDTAAVVVHQLIGDGHLSSQLEDDQICPLCTDIRRTLTPARIRALLAIAPLAEALDAAVAVLSEAEANWRIEVTGFLKALDSRRRSLLVEGLGLTHLGPSVRSLANAALQSAQAVTEAAEEAYKLINGTDAIGAVSPEFRLSLVIAIARVEGVSQAQVEAVHALDQALGTGALADPKYAARAAWLDLTKHRVEAANQLRWEWAVESARVTLADIRKGLIELRTAIIDGARCAFTSSMSQVWGLLRADAGGRFSQIVIPTPKGKGYKLEFEVKALISDGQADAEVDALRVFSESQVNVVGIAAYVTRAAALGHSVLVFDDPVQSMDEEHFKSLAGQLIPYLIDEGRQVIVLTHSDSFARDLSHVHFLRSSYVTLHARFSKRKGCWVEEGSRRVSERLRAAEKLMEDGQLEEGWGRVRLALERLYTLAMKSSTPTFKPDQWRNATAEYMWDQGAGTAISARVPQSVDRLKEILRSTVMGAHDVTAPSATDLSTAIKDIRALLTPLRLGDG